MRMAEAELTSTQVAERLEVSPATVRLWCAQGRFKQARLVAHPRGDYWVIPESELKTFTPPKMGRPPKAQPAGAAGRKYGTIESRTATTRKLNKAFRRAVEGGMAGRKRGKK